MTLVAIRHGTLTLGRNRKPSDLDWCVINRSFDGAFGIGEPSGKNSRIKGLDPGMFDPKISRTRIQVHDDILANDFDVHGVLRGYSLARFVLTEEDTHDVILTIMHERSMLVLRYIRGPS